ncbi:MAG: FtsL-like putative cell division protein [Crocinitomicaceae bacterium]
MSINELIDRATVEQQEEKKKRRKKRRPKKSDAEKKNRSKLLMQIMNGDFLSKDWFINHLPFTFYVGFLLVLLIGWGYYGETTAKKEVQLQEELSELNSEFFTLNSEYITKRGRQQIKNRLEGTGLIESRVSPKKIRVRKYVFE